MRRTLHARRDGVSPVPESDCPPLRLAVNATPLLFPLTGIGHYIQALMRALEQTGQVEADYFYVKGWAKTLRPRPLTPSAHIIKRVLRRYLPRSYQLSRWLQQRAFNVGVRRRDMAVYHEPNFLAFDFDGPTVLTAHDLSWVRYPDTHPIERVRAMDRYFERSLRQASAVITPTQFVKDEVCEVFGIPASQVHVTHEAADAIFRPLGPAQTQSVRASWQLAHGKYWAAVGTLEPRKNLGVLLDAFSMLSPAERKQCPLVVMGMLGWRYADLLPRLQSMVEAGELIYTGYLPRADQAALLAGAKALIYPSLYEGFGLPLVEAMQCGVPVLASNASSLPEVMGDAGKPFDPHDAEALLDIMRGFLHDPLERERMAGLALRRSDDFSWQRCARETIDVYRVARVEPYS